MIPTVIRVRLLDNGILPRRHTEGSAGFDLSSSTDAVIPAHGFATIPVGVALEMPPDIEAQVRPRSGLAARHGIGILNSPGTIDSDYRGEVKVILCNMSGTEFAVHRGDRIAQLVFNRLIAVDLTKVESTSGTERGSGGFGHTGR
jgi:dUTP pyrophosphatase